MNKAVRAAALAALAALTLACLALVLVRNIDALETAGEQQTEKKLIKWIDFNVPLPALKKALELDVKSHTTAGETPVDWIELLAYLAAKNGNNFKKYRDSELTEVAKRLQQGEAMAEIASGMTYYEHYLEAYGAVLGGFVGYYEIQEKDEGGALVWKMKYGLKAFSPIAKGYPYSDYDDFGAARSYGYKRRHLGHDMMAGIGTPITAVESGTVEELGWNRYGGWRVGIRSFDKKRYYYYAHMRKNHPFNKELYKGKTVKAGDVIGYVGRTGYSTTENVNNVKENHLHFGMQIIFDEATQKEGRGEIWIDVYALVRLLSKNRSQVVKDEETKDYSRVYDFREAQASAAANIRSDALEIESTTEVELPVIMYHKVLKHAKTRGDLTITPQELEKDLDYLRSNGYTTVNIEELAAFVYEDASIPAKPVLLTFDDGHYNNLYYAEPLLRERNMKAVMAVVGEFSQASDDTGDVNPNYSYVTWEQVKRASEDAVFEVQSHTWGLHKRAGAQGVKRKSGESEEAYRERLTRDLEKLQDKMLELTGRRPRAFVYPFGAFSAGTLDILLDMGFVSTLTSTEGMNTVVKGKPETLLELKRFKRKPDESTAAFMKRMEGH